MSGRHLKIEDLETFNKTLKECIGDRYEATAQIGSGASGEVYKAQDAMLDREVAIKRIRLDMFQDPIHREEARQRFLREAKVAARLNHPNIVTIHDIVDKPLVNLIVMEFVDGPTLEDELFKKERLDLVEALDILGQTAEGLDYAHEHTVVHRDVKPANIMIERTGRVKVADFGIAKSETSSNITTAGMIMGTPNYMSPEQARGNVEVDSRADIFSLGAIFYECLSGDRPFQADNTMATLLSIVSDELPSLDCDALGIHPGVDDVLHRAMAKDPADRFATAGELVQELRNVAKQKTKKKEVKQEETKKEDKQAAQPDAPDVQPTQFESGLSGSLGETMLAEVARTLYVDRRTGVLHFERDGTQKKIYFEKGTIVFAGSNVKEDRLGEFLIKKGTIDQAVFDEASQAMKKTGQRLGATLVELGHISEESMKGEVAEQFTAIVQSLFEWDTGHFGFESLDELAEEDVVIQVSTAETILAGVRRMESPETIQKALGNLDRVLIPSENPLLLYQKVNLTPEEGFILSRADGTTTAEDTASLSPMGEENTLKCIYGLVAAGVLELQDKSTQKAKPRVAPTPKVVRPKPKVEPAKPRVEPPKPDKAKEKASGKDTKPPKDQNQLREEIAAKHASLATANHYELLEVSTTADENEIKTAYFALVKAYHPDRHHQEHMKDMRGLLEELLAKITDAYQVLTDKNERKKYDRKVLKPEPSNAQTTLGSASAKPTTSPATSGQELSSSSSKELAENQYHEGKRRFADMSYFDAIQCLREAVRLDPSKAAYHKLLAQSLAKNPNWLKDAEEHFQKAIEIDSFDAESFQGLAEIYNTMGMKTRCERVCEKLLRMDPDNALAKELSGKKKASGQTRMRLKSLFGKKD